MTAENKSILFDAAAGGDGKSPTHTNVVSATVPDGEIWYVEGISFSNEDGAGSQSVANLRIGITSADNPDTSVSIDSYSRGSKSGSSLSTGTIETLGAYAYARETVFAGVNRPDAACKGALLIRRVL
jgi:hypothetical protein